MENFILKFWTLLMKKVGIKLNFNMTFCSKTDGQTKRVNGILNQYLQNYMGANHKDWGYHLGFFKICYNYMIHYHKNKYF